MEDKKNYFLHLVKKAKGGCLNNNPREVSEADLIKLLSKQPTR